MILPVVTACLIFLFLGCWIFLRIVREKNVTKLNRAIESEKFHDLLMNAKKAPSPKKQAEVLSYLDRKIIAVQKSTKPPIKSLQPLHEKLRIHFKWYRNLFLDPACAYEDADEEILAIQRSTRTTFKFLQPIHELLRLRSSVYYRWHLNPHATQIHVVVLTLFLSSSMIIGSLSIFGLPNLARAADYTCTWDGTTGNWSDTAKWTNCNSEYPGQTEATSYDVSIPSGTVTLNVNNLNLNNADNSVLGNVTIAGTLTTSNNNLTFGSLVISAGGTVTAGSSILTVYGDWDKAATGTFTYNTSKVVFNGTGTIQNVTLNNPCSFYDLEAAAATKTISLHAYIYVYHVLTLNTGTIRSADAGTAWQFYLFPTPSLTTFVNNGVTYSQSPDRITIIYRVSSTSSASRDIIPAGDYPDIQIYSYTTSTTYYAKMAGAITCISMRVISGHTGSIVDFTTENYAITTSRTGLYSFIVGMEYSLTDRTAKIDLGTSTLTTAGDVTIADSTTGLNEIAANGATLKIAGNYANSDKFTAGTSTVEFTKTSGTQTLNSGGTGTNYLFNNILHSGAGTLQLLTNNLDVDGTFTNSAGTFDADTNDKNMTFAGAWNNTGSATFSRGSGTLTFDGTSTITNSSSAAASLAAVAISGTATLGSNLTMTSNSGAGTLNLGAGSYTLTLTGTGTPLGVTTFQKGTGSTVLHTGTTTATTVATVQYNNLTLTPTGTTTYSLAAALDTANTRNLTGTITINNYATLTTTASNYNIDCVNLTIASGGTLTANASTFTLSGNWDSSLGTVSVGTSTVAITGTSNITTKNWTDTFYNLQTAYTGQTATWLNNGVITHQLILNGNATGSFTSTNPAGPALSGSGSSYDLITTSGATLASSTKILFTGANAIIPATVTYPNVDFASTSTTQTLSGNISSGNIRIFGATSNTATLDLNGKTLTTTGNIDVGYSTDRYGKIVNSSQTTDSTISLTGNLTVLDSTVAGSNIIDASGSGGAPKTININIGGNWANNETFTAGASTVTFNGTASGKTISGNLTSTNSFYNLTINGLGGYWTLGAAMNVSNNFNITNGTLDLDTTNNYAFSVVGNFTGNAGTWSFEMRASTITVSGNWDTSGQAWDSGVNNVLKYATSTVVMDGSGTKTLTTGTTNVWEARFYNLTVGQSGNTTSVQRTTGMAGLVTVGTGTFTSAANQTIYLTKTGDVLSLDASATVSVARIAFHGGAQNFPAHTYSSDIYLTGWSTTVTQTGTVVLNGSLIVNGDSTAARVDAYNSNNNTLTVSGNIQVGYNTTTADTNKTLTLGSSTVSVGGSFYNLGILNSNTSTVDFTKTSGTQTLNSGGTGASQTFNNLTHSGAGTLQLLTNNLKLSGNFLSSGGIFTTTDGTSRDVTVGGNFTISSPSTVTANASTIFVAGNWSNASIFTAGTGTVDFTKASGTQTLTSGGTGTGKLFYNLTHSGAGALQLVTNSLDVNGTFTNSAGTFDAATNNIAMNFAGNWNNTGSATFTRGSGSFYFDGTSTLTDSSSAAGNLGAIYINPVCSLTLGSSAIMTSIIGIIFGTTFNMGAGGYTLTLTGTGSPLAISGVFIKGTGSTVIFTGTTTATSILAYQYNNVTISPTATTTYSLGGSLSGGIAMTGNLTINNYATLTTTASNYNLDCVNLTIATGGTLTANASTFTVSGNWDHSAGTFTYGTSTVNLTGTGNLKIPSVGRGSTAFYNLSVAYSTKTTTIDNSAIQQRIGISNTLYLNGGAFTVNGGNPGEVLFYGTGSVTPLSFVSPTTISILEFLYYPLVSSTTQNIIGGNYGSANVTVAEFDGGANSDIFNQQAAITTTGNVSLLTENYKTGTYNTGGFDITAVNLTVGVNGWPNGAMQFNTNNSTINASGDFKVDNVLSSLTTGTTGTFNVGNLINSSASFAVSGTTTLNITGNITNNTGATITANSSHWNVAGNWTNAGTFTASSSTVDFTKSSGTQTLNSGGTAAANTFNNLTHSGAGTAQLNTNNINIDGTFTNSAGTFDTNSLDMTVAGDFDNTATFTQGTRTVTLDGAGASTQNISGSTTFYNLTAQAAAARTIKFAAASTTTVTNTWDFDGAAGQLLTLNSSSDTNYWKLNISSATPSGTYLAVKDSNASGGNQITATNSTNSGHNLNWTFGGAITIAGSCKAFDETTNCTDSETVRVAVNGSLLPQTTTTATGAWTISGVGELSTSDTLTVFISGVVDAKEANAVTKYDGTGNITGVLLYEDHITIGSDDNQTIANSDLILYDNSVSGNEDIFYEVDANNDLNTDATSQTAQDKLYIKASNTYRPDSASSGNVTTSYFAIAGTVTADGNTFNVVKDLANSGTFTYDTSTVNMTGTGAISQTTSLSFYNLSIAYSTFITTISSSINTYNTITVNGGTATSTSYVNMRRTSSGTPFVFASPTTLTGTFSVYMVAQTNAQTYTIAAGNYGSWNLYVFNQVNSATYQLGGAVTTTGAFQLEASVGVTGATFNTNNNGLTATGFSVGAESRTASWAMDFGSSTISLTTDGVTFGVVSNGGTHTLNLNSSNISAKSNVFFSQGTGAITVTPGSSTVTLNSTATGRTITMGGQAFNNLAFNGSGGGWTLQDTLNVAGNLAITNGTLDTNSSSNNSINVTGNFTGNAGTWTFYERASTITISGNWDTSAVATDSTNLQYGTSTVVMDGTGTKTIKTGTTSGWVPRFNNLNVGQGAGKTTQLNASPWNQVTVNGTLTVGAGTFDLNGDQILIKGSPTALILDASATFGLGTGYLSLFGSGQNLPAHTYNVGYVINESSGNTITQTGDVVITGHLYVNQNGGGRTGTYTTGNYALTVQGNLVLTDNVATLNLGSSSVTVGGNWTNPSIGVTPGILNAGSSTVTFNGTAAQTITSGSQSFYNLTLNNTGTDGTANDDIIPAGNLDVNGNFTITNGQLRLDTNNPTLNIVGNTSIGASGTWTKGTGAITFDGLTAATYTDSTATPQNIGTVVLNKTDTIAPLTNNKLTLASSMTVDTINVDGTLLSQDTLDLGSLGGFTLTLANTGATATVFTVGTNAVISPGNSIVKYTATNSGGDINVTTTTYNTLQVSGTETYVLTGHLTGGNAMTGTLISNGSSILTTTGSNYNISCGSLTVNSGGTMTANASTITVSGDWDTSTGTFTYGTSTVIMTGTSKTISPASGFRYNAKFYILTIDTGASVTLSSTDFGLTNLNVNGTFTLTGKIVEPFNLTTVGANGVLTGTGTLFQVGYTTNTFSNAGTISISNFTYDINTDTTSSPITATDYGTGCTLTITRETGTGAARGGVVVTNPGRADSTLIAGAIVITGGGGYLTTLDNSADNYPVNSSSITIGVNSSANYGKLITGSGTITNTGNLTINAGTAPSNNILDASANPTINVGGNWTNGDTFTAGASNVNFNGTATGKTINTGGTGTGKDFYNLTFNGSGGAWSPLTNTVTVTNDLTMTAGTFDNSNGSANVIINGSAVGISGIINFTTNTFTQRVSAAELFGTTAYGSVNWTFYNLKFENSSASDRTITTSSLASTGQIIISGTLTIGNASDTNTTTLDNETNDHIFDCNGDLTITSKGSFSVSSTASFTVAGNWLNSGTFTANLSIVNLNGSSTQTLTPGSSSFYDLTISNTTANGVQVATNALTTTHALTLASNAVLDLNALGLTTTGATFTSSGTLRMEGGQTVTGLTSGLTTGTTELDGSAAYTTFPFASGFVFNNLRVIGSGSWTLSPGAANYNIYCNGNFDLTSNLTISPNQFYSFNLYADYNNNGTGTFNQTAGTLGSSTNYLFASIYSGGNTVLNNITFSGISPLVYIYSDNSPNLEVDNITVNGTVSGVGSLNMYANVNVTMNNSITTSTSGSVQSYCDYDNTGSGDVLFGASGTITATGSVLLHKKGSWTFSSTTLDKLTTPSVTLQSGNGSLTINGDINKVYNTLTLYASANLNINDNITITGTPGTLYLFADSSATGAGDVSIATGKVATIPTNGNLYYKTTSSFSASDLFTSKIVGGTGGALTLTSTKNNVTIDQELTRTNISLYAGNDLNVNYNLTSTNTSSSYFTADNDSSGVGLVKQAAGTTISNGGYIYFYASSNDVSKISTIANVTQTGTGIIYFNKKAGAINAQYSVYDGSIITSNAAITIPATAAVTANNSAWNVKTNFSCGAYTSLVAGTSTITFNGTVNQTITTNGVVFNNIVVNNTGAAGSNKIRPDIYTFNVNDITIQQGTLDLATSDPNVVISGNTTIANSAVWTKQDTTTTTTFAGSGKTFKDSNATTQDIGSVTINGTLTVDSSGVGMKVYTLGINSSKSLDISNTVLTIIGVGSAFTSSGNFIGTNSTVKYIGASATNIASVPYGNLQLTPASGSVTYSLAGNLTGSSAMSGNVIIDANATLDTTASNYNISCVDMTVNASGTLTPNASTITASGSWDHSAGTFTKASNTSTVVLDGGTASITAGQGTGKEFYNLTIQKGANTLTVNGHYTVLNILTLTSGTLSFPAYTEINLYPAVTGCYSNAGITFAGAAVPNIAMNVASTDSGAPDIIPAGTYPRLTIRSTSNGSWNYSKLAGDILTSTGSGFFMIAPGADNRGVKIDADSHNITVTEHAYIGYSADTRSGQLDMKNGTLTITGNLTIRTSDGTWENKLTTGATGQVKVGGDYINSDTIDTSAGGTFEFTKSSSTQTLNSGGTAAANTFYNITHSGAGTLQLTTNNINIDGNFNNSAGTFDANDLNMNVADDFLISGGSFSADVSPGATTQTVAFDSTNAATITGTTTFNNLTMDTTTDGAKTITFPTGSGNKQIINGTWTLDGDTGKVLTLVSASPATAWYFEIASPFTAGDNINVTDSWSNNTNKITPGANTTNGGNNAGWAFGITLSVDHPTLSFGSLIPGDIFTGYTETSVTINWLSGYSLSISDGVSGSDSALLHSDASTRVIDYAGTIATPTSWSGNGLGICFYSGTGKDAKWGTGTTDSDSNNKYAGVPQTETIINTNNSTTISGDTARVGYKLVVPNTQKTGDYSGTITYTATALLPQFNNVYLKFLIQFESSFMYNLADLGESAFLKTVKKILGRK